MCYWASPRSLKRTTNVIIKEPRIKSGEFCWKQGNELVQVRSFFRFSLDSQSNDAHTNRTSVEGFARSETFCQVNVIINILIYSYERCYENVSNYNQLLRQCCQEEE